MNICIIANNAHGLYVFRKKLICALIEKGHKITVFVPFDSEEALKVLRTMGVRLIETPMERRGTNPVRDASLIHLYKKELKKLRPDLVITYTIKPNIYGGIICRWLKIPYVANITGLGSAFEKKGLLYRFVIALYRHSLATSGLVFFENEHNCELFVKLGIIDRSKSYVLNGAGVDLEHFSYEPYPMGDQKEFRFLFIGRVMKEKGIIELIRATERLVMEGGNCRLDVVGYYDDDNCKELISKIENVEWLCLHGVQEDVRPFIRKCDCFVLPSYHEGMANTNLECAASGRPIITSDIPGCREAVTSESGYLCLPRDVESLYNAMKDCMSKSSKEREKMGKTGREHMIKFFNKNDIVAKTIAQLGNRNLI